MRPTLPRLDLRAAACRLDLRAAARPARPVGFYRPHSPVSADPINLGPINLGPVTLELYERVVVHRGSNAGIAADRTAA